MKATLTQEGIKLTNGVLFLASDGESKEDFIQRVTSTVDRDYCDTLEIEDDGTFGEETNYEAELEDLERENYEDYLAEESAEWNQDFEEASEFEELNTKLDGKEKTVTYIEEAGEVELEVIGELHSETKYFEETIAENKGKVCEFPKRLTGEIIKGQIIWIYPDKRKNLVYYRVKTPEGKIHIVRINNPALKIY
jgi:hypothetical protein